MNKKIAALLAGALCLTTLTACGGSNGDAQSADGGAADADKTITVGASPTPHAEILNAAKDVLAEQGWTLEVVEFTDYVQPNTALVDGDLDANYFQHVPYLNNFNQKNGADLVSAIEMHYEPFGIYPGTKSDLSELEEGDEIAVPNDTTNEARALLLLQDNGIITLEEGVGLMATKNDIVDNPYGIEILELEAAQVPRVAEEVAFAVMNGNYALNAGFSVANDSIAYEAADSEAAKTYVNVIAVKEGNEDSEAIRALVEVLKSQEIQDFINETYDGAVIPFVESADAEAETEGAQTEAAETEAQTEAAETETAAE